MVDAECESGIEQPDARTDVPDPVVAELGGVESQGARSGGRASNSDDAYCRLWFAVTSIEVCEESK